MTFGDNIAILFSGRAVWWKRVVIPRPSSPPPHRRRAAPAAFGASISCVTPTGPTQFRLESVSTALAYFWFTGFFPCTGLDKLKAAWKNRAVTGNFQSQLCCQYAPVRVDKPGAAAAVGSLLVGAGESCTGEVDVSADTDDQMFMRVGIAYSLSSGTTLGAADVTLDLHTVVCGRIASTVTRDYFIYNTASVVHAICAWLPEMEAQKIKVGVVVSGLTGAGQWRIAWRTAATSTEAPGSWTTTESWRNTNNTEVNTGEITVSAASDMYIQVGVELSLSTGSTPAQVTLVTTVAVRRS